MNQNNRTDTVNAYPLAWPQGFPRTKTREQWISVKEQMPPKFEEVLVAFAGSTLPATGQFTDNPNDKEFNRWCVPSENDAEEVGQITHWMPLPEHPDATPSEPSSSGEGHCMTDTLSSRVCERGTKSCVVQHALLAASRAAESEPTDEQLMAVLYSLNYNESARLHRTVWKDSIDIDVPSGWYRSLVRELAKLSRAGSAEPEASAQEVREAFGDLSDAALAGLAGASPEQIERIEQFILRECYPMHESEEDYNRAFSASLEAGENIEGRAGSTESEPLRRFATEALVWMESAPTDKPHSLCRDLRAALEAPRESEPLREPTELLALLRHSIAKHYGEAK